MRLPPLNAVRTFEVAGRHENFSAAAAELNVTPGAVSRQIRLLEAHLGVALFVRARGGVRLTEAGRAYLASVQRALAGLDAGTREVSALANPQPLQVWGSRFFIRLWLVPRLNSFHARFPDQEVVITSVFSSEPMPPEADVGLRFGDGHWSGMRAHHLIGRNLVPVCSPAYLKASPLLERPEDLARHTLLQTVLGAEDWGLWYKATGAPPVELGQRISFTSADVAYSAALDGVGLVLGRRGFIERDLDAGALVAPFDFTVAGEGAFYLVYRDAQRLPARVTQFRSWILGELGDQEAIRAG
jgi:LysR family glycine cleavage system transcriptional activator